MSSLLVIFVWGGVAILQVLNLVRNRVLNSCNIWSTTQLNTHHSHPPIFSPEIISVKAKRFYFIKKMLQIEAKHFSLVQNLGQPKQNVSNFYSIQKLSGMPLVRLFVILSICLQVCLSYCQSVVCSHLSITVPPSSFVCSCLACLSFLRALVCLLLPCLPLFLPAILPV